MWVQLHLAAAAYAVVESVQMNFVPSYQVLLTSGELASRVETASHHLANCDVCPLACGANRLEGKTGVCKTGLHARVSSYGPHHGEEGPLRGRHGSGTIFFTRCNLHCSFCQNADISQLEAGSPVEPDELATIMLKLQNAGCHNINLVSPSHVVPQILAAVSIAAQAGLHLPLVYNSGGYDSLEMLALLDGVVDIYMPDMKYADEAIARKFSKVPDYPGVNQAAVCEMQRQVGDLQVDEHGIATRGLLVRHLVLPNHLAGTETILRFLAEDISPHVYLNIMDQYDPAYLARNIPELSRRITQDEYRVAVRMVRQFGLQRLSES